jgi:hypothetical protein
MANGRRESTVFRGDANGARSISPWTRPFRHGYFDTAISDIRTVAFTPSSDGDSPVLPELLDRIPEGEEIGTVTAGGTYDTRRCHTAIIDHPTIRAIPIRKNGRPWTEDCPAARTRNETLRATRHYGRAFWKRWTGYNARSRIGVKMRGLKAFGERINKRPRPPNRRNPDPRCTHQSLQRTRHRRNRSRDLSTTGKGAVRPQA